MLNFITNEQMRKADEYTIKHLPIRSIDLMEQACNSFVKRITEDISVNEKITVCCGTGNNGGDGLAIARLLRLKGYNNITVIILNIFSSSSPDFIVNKKRLNQLKIPLFEIKKANELPNNLDIVIDAVLGSGFQGTLKEPLAEIIKKINHHAKYIFSVDCPSGLNIDSSKIKKYQGIKADKTISFQRPKLFFMFPESIVSSKSHEFVFIGLNEDFLQSLPSDYFWIEEKDIVGKLKVRQPFSHKGIYGHLLIIGGMSNTMGAAVLCAKSALFTGVGLVTCCVPKENFSTLNISQPEIMTLERENFNEISLNKFNSVAIGPGLGLTQNSKEIVHKILKEKIPVVFDADALNIISEENWLGKIPANSILTPHLKEFDRLFGSSEDWFARLEKARCKAKELQCIIVLKNQYTFTLLTD